MINAANPFFPRPEPSEPEPLEPTEGRDPARPVETPPVPDAGSGTAAANEQSEPALEELFATELKLQAKKEPETVEAPDAALEAALRERRQPAPSARSPMTHRARGIEWVRPSDLVARGTAHLAGKGVDFHAELNRLARQAIGAGMHRAATSARKLPPVTAFGRPTQQEPQTPAHRIDVR